MSLPSGRVRLSGNPIIPGGSQDADFEVLSLNPDPGPIPPTPPQIDINSIMVHNSPTDIARWNQTRLIKSIQMNPASGWTFGFDQPLPDSWICPFGDEGGTLQYTVWAVVFVNGIWQGSGIVQMWPGRPDTGAFGLPTWHDDFHANWCYDSRWGDMSLYYPNPGDLMGFLVSAGNARGQAGITSVKERSNLVALTLPVGDVGSWSF